MNDDWFDHLMEWIGDAYLANELMSIATHELPDWLDEPLFPIFGHCFVERILYARDAEIFLDFFGNLDAPL